jgi:hypothetical protein
MKITKQRILEIIKEEVKASQQDDKAVSSRQDLGSKMIEAGKAIKGAQNIDSAEAQLIEAFLDEIIKKANEGNAKTVLVTALKVVKQKLGTDK